MTLRPTKYLIVIASVLAFAAPAAAQMAGYYSGQTLDGNLVDVSVVPDGNGGFYAENYTWGISSVCSDGSIFDVSIINLAPTTITNRKFAVSEYQYVDIPKYKFTFSKDGMTATGTTSTTLALLTPRDLKAKKAVFCQSPSQPVNLTYQGNDNSKVHPRDHLITIGEPATGSK